MTEPLDQATLEAVARVREAVDQADFDCGHVISSDNICLADLRTILDALQPSSQGDET